MANAKKLISNFFFSLCVLLVAVAIVGCFACIYNNSYFAQAEDLIGINQTERAAERAVVDAIIHNMKKTSVAWKYDESHRTGKSVTSFPNDIYICVYWDDIYTNGCYLHYSYEQQQEINAYLADKEQNYGLWIEQKLKGIK